MKTYSQKMVDLLDVLCYRANFLIESVSDTGYNLEYDFNGQLPAYPERYNKRDWEEKNDSIEEIVNNYVIPELKRAVSDYPALKELNNIYNVIDSIDWSEV